MKNKNKMKKINLLQKNKKGADKVISVYWFLILVIVAGGIFAMVYTFYGAPYDVREIESNILSQKVADCISQNGKLDSQLISEGNFNEDFKNNFLQNCDLTFETENEFDWNEEQQYFIDINFYTLEDLKIPKEQISAGNLNFISDCAIKDKKNKDYKTFAKCSENRFYALDENNNQYLINILTGIAKLEKNVKQ